MLRVLCVLGLPAGLPGLRPSPYWKQAGDAAGGQHAPPFPRRCLLGSLPPLCPKPHRPTTRPRPAPPPPAPAARSVGRCKRKFAEMCVRAVLAVADLERRDVNLDLIKAGFYARLKGFLLTCMILLGLGSAKSGGTSTSTSSRQGWRACFEFLRGCV